MWVVTAPFDIDLPEKVVGHGDEYKKEKALKCGVTYTIGRHGDLSVKQKFISKLAGTLIVGGWTVDDVCNAGAIPTLELINQASKPLKVDRPEQPSIPVASSERVSLEDGCEIWLTSKITMTVRWRRIVCYETQGKVRAPISLDGCASLGINVLQTHHPLITHHLVPSYNLTPPLVSSLLCAAHLVKPDWLREVLRLGSLERGQSGCLEDHWILPAESAYRPGFASTMRNALKEAKTWEPKAERVNMFKERRFVFVGEKGREAPYEFVQVVERGSGTYESFTVSNNVARFKKLLMKALALVDTQDGAVSVVADAEAMEAAVGAGAWKGLVQAAADLELTLIQHENILQAVAYVDLFYVNSNARLTASNGIRGSSQSPAAQKNTNPERPTKTMLAESSASGDVVNSLGGEGKESAPSLKHHVPTRRSTRASSRQPSLEPESTSLPKDSELASQVAPRRPPPRRGNRKINVGFDDDDDDDSVTIDVLPVIKSRAGSEQPAVSATQGSLMRPRSRRQASKALPGFDDDENTPGIAGSSGAATQLSKHRALFEASASDSQMPDRNGPGEMHVADGLGAILEEEEESTASFLAYRGGNVSVKRKADAMELDEEDARETPNDLNANTPEGSQTQIPGQLPPRSKRRAVEGVNSVEVSAAPPARAPVSPEVPPRQKPASSQVVAFTKPPSATNPADKKSKAAAVDTDQQFLKALNSTKRGKKKEDEFDRDFNKLRITKPEPSANERKEEWEVLADFGDDSIRGNFMVIVDLDVDMVSRREARAAPTEDTRWLGKKDFKKFVKKGQASAVRRRTKPIELVVAEDQEFAPDAGFELPLSQDETNAAAFSQTAPPSRSRSKPLASIQGKGRNRFAVAESDENSDDPATVPTHKPGSRTTVYSQSTRSKKTPLFTVDSDEDDTNTRIGTPLDEDRDESMLREITPAVTRGTKRKAAAPIIVEDDEDEATFKGFGRRKRGRV